MSLVASTGGFTLLPTYVQSALIPSVVARPLHGEVPTIDLVMGYNKSNTSPLLKKFSIRKFRITLRFPRIVTGDFRNRSCSSSCSKKSSPNASQSDWCVETSYRSMEPSLRQTLPRKAAFRGSSWPKPRRSIERCASTWLSLNCRTR